MAEDAPVVEEIPGVLVEERTLKEMILFKMDRTIAVVGIILLGCWALSKGTPDVNVTMAAVSGLVGYIGGRTGK